MRARLQRVRPGAGQTGTELRMALGVVRPSFAVSQILRLGAPGFADGWAAAWQSVAGALSRLVLRDKSQRIRGMDRLKHRFMFS
ncbi:MAG: hypothetical protein ACU0GG_02675 [Paracoccaceae bacterium]